MTINVKKKNRYKDTIGERIKSFREFLGKNGVQFSEIIKIKQNTLSQMEKGMTKPSAGTIANLIRYTDINPDYLLLGEGPVVREPKLPAAEIPADGSRPEGQGPDLYDVVEPVSGKATIVTRREMRQIHKLLRILKSEDKGVIQATEVGLREWERLSRLINARFGDIIILERRVNNIPVENERRKKAK
jgi:transcriptional regulator with XRE-family HTH domain